MNKEKIDALNEIGAFLGRRDLEELSSKELYKSFEIKEVDVLILLGSAITYNIDVAMEAYKRGLCKKILICGGIGHSTNLLREAVESSRYENINLSEESEADIILQIIKKYFNINHEDIIIENKSTNCGDNAKKAIELLDELNIEYNSLILIQDPTMQLRTYASFLKYTKGKKNLKIINYSPFSPKLNEFGEFYNKEVHGIWSIDRYEDLILGEIPRLRDDETGYGPKGADYIAHIDIPDKIENSYLKLSSILGRKTR